MATTTGLVSGPGTAGLLQIDGNATAVRADGAAGWRAFEEVPLVDEKIRSVVELTKQRQLAHISACFHPGTFARPDS